MLRQLFGVFSTVVFVTVFACAQDGGKQAPKSVAEQAKATASSANARTDDAGASSDEHKAAEKPRGDAGHGSDVTVASKTAKAESPDFAAPEDVAAAPNDARKTDSGLAYKVIVPGKGTEHPKATDTVVVHYTGWTTDGKMFDSSYKRDRPASFPLNRVIKGWTEGVQLMAVGEKTRFWIPGDLAYGETPRRPGAPAGTLVFDIELLEIK